MPENNICPCPDGSMPEHGWCGTGVWRRGGGYGVIHIWGRQIPTYSYVYTYENKTIPEIPDITYPDYNVTTTRWEDGVYKEPEGW